MTLSADAVQRQRKTGESPIPARTQRCWRVSFTAPTVERRCPVLCTQTATSWRMVAFGRKYNQSTIAFSGDRRIKGGRDCDGQALYLAERVDAIVLQAVSKIFEQIRDTPYSRMAENRIRQESNLQKSKRASVEKKIKTAQHALERFEGEILKCLDSAVALPSL